MMKNIISVLLILVCQQAHAAATASNSDYTCTPPYLSQNAKPNINLVLDHTGSMLRPAYISCSNSSFECQASSPGSVSYDSSTNYFGYFKSDLYYKYNSSGYWEENSSCTTTTDRKGFIGATASTACLSGNILNLAATTRINVLRKILTGGRFNTTTSIYTDEGDDYVFTDSTTKCKFTVTLSNSATTNRSIKLENSSSGTVCSLLGGALSSTTYKLDNKTTTPGEVTGVVHSLYPAQADLELSVFNTGVEVMYRTGKNKSLADYINAINTEYPGGATNTEPALTEAKKYFSQTNMAANANTTLMIAKTDPAKDPYYDIGPLAVPCRKSFVLLISDGEWNRDGDPLIPAYYMRMNDLRTDASLPGAQNVTTYTVYAFGDGDQGRNAMINTAMWGGFSDKDGNNAPYPFSAVTATQKASGTYTPFSGGKNSKTYPASTTTFPISACDPNGTWNAACDEWDQEKTGLPYNFFEASEGSALQNQIIKALKNILGKASSGTAASVMGNNDNSGSTLLQALYFPEKQFKSGSTASWIGELQSFWYFVDPKLDNITIREDSISDFKLKLGEDKIAEFGFDGSNTKVKLYSDANGDGVKDTPAAPYAEIDPDDAKPLWRAGQSLWSRDADDRNIFTNDPDQTTATKLDFKSDSATVAKLYRHMDTDDTSAAAVISYVRGNPVDTTYRNRTVTIDGTASVWKLGDIINSTPKLQSEVRLNSYNLRQPGGYADISYDQYTKSRDYNWRGTAYVGANDGMLHAFKIGSNFSGSSRGTIAEIKNNNGTAATELGKELWAFIPKNTLPYLQYLLLPSYQHIFMVDSTPLLIDASINPTTQVVDGTTLTCTDTTYSSCVKKTSVDSSTGQLLYDKASAKGGTSWRTLLLSGSGMGGAASPTRAETKGIVITVSASKKFTRAAGSFISDGFAVGTIFAASGFSNASNNGYFTVSAVTATEITCSGASGLVNETGPVSARLQQITVKTPIMDPNDTATPKTRGFGYSSVFALDVTDSDPKLLWEFSDPRLGFTTVAPAIVRIKDAADTGSGPQRNGKWFAVYASGPSGPINNGWFMGISDKKLTIFVLDLKSGELVRTFSSAATDGINTQFTLPVDAPAFAGSLSGSTTDTDKFESSRAGAYSDNAVYIGYTRGNSATAPTAWNKGGVLRLLTYDNPDPATWKISTLVDGIGPVTSAVTKLQDATNSKLWLYFGTGRYYTKDDDSTNVQSLFGIKDPCFITDNKFAADCHTSSTYAAPTVTAATSANGATFSGLVNQTSSIGTVAASNRGWKIDLPAGNGTTTNSKRVITDTLASTNGVVNFTTFTPSRDVCSYGGTSSVWAVKYNTGGSGVLPNLKGQLLIQLSTGAFQQVDMSKAFTLNLGRETPPFNGVPPVTPPALTGNTNHFPTKRFLHIQER